MDSSMLAPDNISTSSQWHLESVKYGNLLISECPDGLNTALINTQHSTRNFSFPGKKINYFTILSLWRNLYFILWMHKIRRLILALDVYTRSFYGDRSQACDLAPVLRIIFQLGIESYLSDRGFVDRCEETLWQKVTREAILNSRFPWRRDLLRLTSIVWGIFW